MVKFSNQMIMNKLENVFPQSVYPTQASIIFKAAKFKPKCVKHVT